MTIGHSTRTAADFLALLKAHAVTGIAYIHIPGLGGLRKPAKDSVNSGWRVEGFRGYADHMQSAEFRAGLDALLAFSETHLAAVMCAEAKWWQCHRQLIADALVASGVDVRHILSAGDPPPHQLTPFARANDPEVTYPGLI